MPRPKPDHPFMRKFLKDEDIIEYAMRDVYSEFLKDEPSFAMVDGGAHAGFHTEFFAKLSNCRHIYAVEANQELARDLPGKLTQKCAQLVEVIPAAIQRDPTVDSIQFMLSDDHPGRSGISSIFQFDDSVKFRTVTLPATTIDKITAERKYPVRFMKLDLEGGEFNAIRGATRLLKEDRPVIAMENSVYAPQLGGYSVQEYFDTFKAIDYVPITFLAEYMNEENMFDLNYAWAAPKEHAERVRLLIEKKAR